MRKCHFTDQEQTFLRLLLESHERALDVFGHCEALGLEHNDKHEDQMARAFASVKHELETK